MNSSQFEQGVLAGLRRLSWRLRGYVLLDGLAFLVVIVLLLAAAHFLLDWTVHLRKDMRAVLLVVLAGWMGWLTWRRLVQPQQLHLGIAEAATLVERRFADLGSVLISAVRFSRGEIGPAQANSRELAVAVIDQADQRVRGLKLSQVLDHARARRSAAVFAGVLLVFAAAFVFASSPMGIWFERAVLLADTPWPQRNKLIVDWPGGVMRAARGDDVEIRARVAEGYAAPRWVEIRFADESGDRGHETMVGLGGREFRYTFTRVEEGFSFHLAGGDDVTDVYTVELVDRPSLGSAQIRIEPPAYTLLAEYSLPEDARLIEVLPGSTVELDVTTNKPVTQAELMAGGQRVADAVGGGTSWQVSFQPQRTDAYLFALLDELGLEDTRPVRFAVRMKKDAPPRVRLEAAGVGDLITRQAVLPMHLEISDEYGLAGAEMVLIISREDQLQETFPVPGFESAAKRYEDQFDWAAQSASLVNGDRLTLFARAWDADDVSGPNQADSSALSLRVVTADELLAELARREHEYRGEFERVVEAQEGLRRDLLTWLGEAGSSTSSGQIARSLAVAEQRQRQIAGRVNAVRQQFEQVMSQLRINRLDSEVVRQRLGDGIIAPLSQLGKRDTVAAADALRRFSRDRDSLPPAEIDRQQERLIADMQAALANMLKWEGFQETVSMLRDILKLQNELNEETRKKIEELGSDIFDKE